MRPKGIMHPNFTGARDLSAGAVDPPGEEGKQAKEGGYDGEDRKRVRDRGVAPAHCHEVLA